MTHLFLIRHADCLYDLVDGQYPKRNLGLTPEGVKQAERLRDRLVRTGDIKPEVFISITERGALETAEIVASAIGQSITQDRDVEEWRSEDGTLSTDAFMEPWHRLTAAERLYYRWVEGCETLLEFGLWVHVALHRILHEHEGKTVLITRPTACLFKCPSSISSATAASSHSWPCLKSIKLQSHTGTGANAGYWNVPMTAITL